MLQGTRGVLEPLPWSGYLQKLTEVPGPKKGSSPLDNPRVLLETRISPSRSPSISKEIVEKGRIDSQVNAFSGLGSEYPTRLHVDERP